MVSGALRHPFQKKKTIVASCTFNHLLIKEDTLGPLQVLEAAYSTPINTALAQILVDLEDFQV